LYGCGHCNNRALVPVPGFSTNKNRLVCQLDMDATGWAANSFVCFRKTFYLEESPGMALTGIAGDTKYWLWVNGQMAVREGGLKRGPTREDTYYDNLDVAPCLKAGNNMVAILVWHWGAHGFSHNNRQ
jgi:hypothetical protein